MLLATGAYAHGSRSPSSLSSRIARPPPAREKSRRSIVVDRSRPARQAVRRAETSTRRRWPSARPGPGPGRDCRPAGHGDRGARIPLARRWRPRSSGWPICWSADRARCRPRSTPRSPTARAGQRGRGTSAGRAERGVPGRARPGPGRRRRRAERLAARQRAGVVRSLRSHAARHTRCAPRPPRALRLARAVVSRVRAPSRPAAGGGGRGRRDGDRRARVAVARRHRRRSVGLAGDSRGAAGVGANLGRCLASAGLGSARASPAECRARLHRSRRRAQPGAVRGPARRAAIVPARARPGHPLPVGRTRSRVVTFGSRNLARPARGGRTVVQRPHAVPRASPTDGGSADVGPARAGQRDRSARRGHAVPWPGRDQLHAARGHPAGGPRPVRRLECAMRTASPSPPTCSSDATPANPPSSATRRGAACCTWPRTGSS